MGGDLTLQPPPFPFPAQLLAAARVVAGKLTRHEDGGGEEVSARASSVNEQHNMSDSEKFWWVRSARPVTGDNWSDLPSSGTSLIHPW